MNTSQDSSLKNLANGVGLASSSRLIGGLLNLFLIVFLTRLLDKSEFAVIAAIYLIMETINAVGPLGLPAALAFYIPKIDDSCKRHLGLWTGVVLFLLATPFSAAIWFGAPYLESISWFSGLNLDSVNNCLKLVALAILFDFTGQVLPGYLLAKQRFGATSLVTLAFYLFRFLGMVIPAYLNLPLEFVIGSLAVTSGMRTFAFLIYFGFIEKGSINKTTRSNWKTKEIFSYGLPLSFSMIVGKLNIQADKYFILAFTTAEVYAIYTAGAVEIPLVAGLAYSVTNALVPTLVGHYHAGQKNKFISTWHISVEKVAIIIIPMAAFLAVFAHQTVRLFFSAKYSEAAIPFRIYLALLPLRLCAYGAVVRATGLTKPILMASICSLAVNIGLNYPLYRLLGVPGPAVASVFAQIIAIIWLLSIIRKQLQVSWLNIFPFKNVLKIAFASVIAGSAAASLLLWNTSDITIIIIGALIFVSVYLPTGKLLKVIKYSDIKFVFNLLTLKSVRSALKRKKI